MAKFVTSKYRAAEGIYPAMPMQIAQTMPLANPCRDCEAAQSHPESWPIFPP
jgi:hypothetical protein